MKVQLPQRSALDALQEISAQELPRLESVCERVTEGCRDLVALKFPENLLVFEVDPDSDTIAVSCQQAGSFDLAELTCADEAQPWPRLLGKTFGWGWVTVNQQGYQDGVLLSFDGLSPSILLNVTASSVQVFMISEATDKK